MRVQPIGVCRFSLVVTGGFQRGPQQTPEARAAWLFQDHRITTRLAWFAEVALPSIMAQEDRNFNFVVLASTLMPPCWQAVLRDVMAGAPPHVTLEFVEPGPHHKVCGDAICRRITPRAQVTAQFRLDDDDAVARDYVARIRSDFHDGLINLYRRYKAVSCDYARGLVLEDDGH